MPAKVAKTHFDLDSLVFFLFFIRAFSIIPHSSMVASTTCATFGKRGYATKFQLKVFVGVVAKALFVVWWVVQKRKTEDAKGLKKFPVNGLVPSLAGSPQQTHIFDRWSVTKTKTFL